MRRSPLAPVAFVLDVLDFTGLTVNHRHVLKVWPDLRCIGTEDPIPP